MFHSTNRRSGKEGVIAIRRLDDTKKVVSMLPDVEHVVVIGGGVLGLEAAWELKKAGCQVTVLEAACQLMGRQLDDAAGEMLKHISEQQGVQIYTGVSIASIDGEDNVTGVTLTDGRTFPAELVIVSAGVRANTALAKTAGIEVDRAVIVNSKWRRMCRIFMHVVTVHSMTVSTMQSGRKHLNREKWQERMRQEKRWNMRQFRRH